MRRCGVCKTVIDGKVCTSPQCRDNPDGPEEKSLPAWMCADEDDRVLNTVDEEPVSERIIVEQDLPLPIAEILTGGAIGCGLCIPMYWQFHRYLISGAADEVLDCMIIALLCMPIIGAVIGWRLGNL